MVMSSTGDGAPEPRANSAAKGRIALENIVQCGLALVIIEASKLFVSVEYNLNMDTGDLYTCP